MSAEKRGTAIRRRATRIGTAVAATATVCGLGLTATPAFADAAAAAPLGIGRATTVGDQHGSFTVPVWSDDPADPVAAVTAVIRDGDTPVGDPITLAAAGTAVETWTLPAGQGPLQLTEDGGRMPHLGRYAIDITATDAAGATLDRTDAGTLDFTLRPQFTGTPQFSPATVDYTHRDVTVAGTLVGIQPGSGDQVPLDGRDIALDLRGSGSGPVTATLHGTTDASGHYAVTTSADAGAYFEPRFAEDSDEVDGSTSGAGQPSYRSTAVTVTAGADHTRVLPGKTFKVSGVVRYGESASSSAPVVAGAQVTVELSCSALPYDPVHAPQAVTDATGHYSVTVIADPECSGDWTAFPSSPFLDSYPGTSGHLAFPDESSFSGVSAGIAADGYVTVTGKLLRTYHRAWTISGQNTFLWYSRDGKTGWTRLKGATTADTGAFKLAAYGYVDGYYQVRHTDTDQLAASSGPVVRLTRTDTRVVSLKAGKTRVKKNTVITVSGTLQQLTNGAWRAYGKQHVELFFLPKGGKTWKYVSSGTTGTNGSVALHAKVTGDGKWLIQYFGDSTHFSSGATPVYVEMI